MTPEQKVRQKLTNLIKRTLPKGRYVLQPIETNQVGVPDFYFIYNGQSMWFETKTTDYRADPYQCNWASTHQKAGGITYVITHIPAPPAAHQQPHTPPPNQPPTPTYSSSPSGLYALLFDSKMLDHSTLGRYINADRPQLRAMEDLLGSLG